MREPDQPKPMTDAKGRFLPGHKLSRGRPKGSPNQFGPNFREKLLAGIARSGVKKARKAGVNQKVDGIEYFVENLVDTNGGAAATLIAKLIPPEEPKPEKGGGGITNVNVINIPPNHQVCPDGNFRPEFEAVVLWRQHREAEKRQPDNVVTLREPKSDDDDDGNTAA